MALKVLFLKSLKCLHGAKPPMDWASATQQTVLSEADRNVEVLMSRTSGESPPPPRPAEGWLSSSAPTQRSSFHVRHYSPLPFLTKPLAFASNTTWVSAGVSFSQIAVPLGLKHFPPLALAFLFSVNTFEMKILIRSAWRGPEFLTRQGWVGERTGAPVQRPQSGRRG